MIDATGNALHMGKIDSIRTVLARNPDGTGVIDGKVLVLTAANGDELHGTFAGQSEPAGSRDQFHVKATFVLKGGTGRFENATGTGEMAAVLTRRRVLRTPVAGNGPEQFATDSLVERIAGATLAVALVV